MSNFLRGKNVIFDYTANSIQSSNGWVWGVWSDGSQGCGAGCSCVLKCGVFGFVLFLSTASILRYSYIRNILFAPKKYKDAIMTTHSEDMKKYFCFLGDSALSGLLKEMRLLGSQSKTPAASWKSSTCGRWWGCARNLAVLSCSCCSCPSNGRGAVPARQSRKLSMYCRRNASP